ncbi:DUF6316 family protein [Spartinivicinus ruber]|uniref:DUF6316 family protein n=1 Tax=Spartinivicinus ruber TaxID=2683272 RepID=UPI0013CFF253|nr:DUF6316 family protein [Spartinivicinus ruber]
MPLFRKNEADNLFVKHHGRYLQTQDGWYFYTREGKTLGPYDSKDLAIEGLNQYLEFLPQAHPVNS